MTLHDFTTSQWSVLTSVAAHGKQRKENKTTVQTVCVSLALPNAILCPSCARIHASTSRRQSSGSLFLITPKGASRVLQSALLTVPWLARNLGPPMMVS